MTERFPFSNFFSAGLSVLSLSVLLAAIVFLVGCGPDDGLTRVRVFGSVTYQGKPVRDGQVRFCPESRAAGPLSIAPLKEGKYAFDHHGGVPVGTHTIRIRAWDPELPLPQGPTDPERPQLLPAKYNLESEIMLKIEEQGGWLEKDFNLE